MTLQDNIFLEIEATKVANIFGVTVEDIRGKSRLRENVLPRQMFHYVVYNYYGVKFTLRTIGIYTNRHWATVINSVKIINNDLDTKQQYTIDCLNAYRDA